MAEDNLCDKCKSPLEIRRNAKGTRYLACPNGCGSKKKKNEPAPAPKGTPKSRENNPAPAPKRNFFSLR